MSGLTRRNRTLGELMSELRTRLGFVVQGPAAKSNDAVMMSFLQEANEYVFGELDPPSMRKKTNINISPGSFLYDWNNDSEDEPIDPGSVLSVWLIASENSRSKLSQGISERDRGAYPGRSRPQKYDNLNGQIELWPIPDFAYELQIEYISNRDRFEQQSDRSSVPDRLVFLYALATAKAHYRHPDAQAAAQTFQNMLLKEKFRQKENKRFFYKGSRELSNDAQVVKTEAGYELKVL